MSVPIALSYSALKDYDNCARKFHAVRILRAFKSQPTAATKYGEDVHKAAEEYVMNGTPVPPAFSFLLPVLSALREREGQKLAEHKMAVTPERMPCAWDDKNVWLRGIADLVILRGSRALVVDYKTGNDKYADVEQLRLMALLVFAHYPEVQKVKGALMFVLKNRMHTLSLERKDELTTAGWLRFANRAALIYGSVENDNWPASSSGLCKYCPVTTCEHN